VDGILIFDGVQADKLTPHVEKGGQNLQTVKEYGDVELYVDWCIEAGADSGVYLKNAPQIQMWTNPLGSGGLFNNKGGGKNPLVVADNPPGRWNTFHIIQHGGDMTTIWLNGQLVVDHVKMENYWDYSKPLPAKGNIELQYHGDKLYWKNIYARDLKYVSPPARRTGDGAHTARRMLRKTAVVCSDGSAPSSSRNSFRQFAKTRSASARLPAAACARISA
jgi:hypothetical protein